MRIPRACRAGALIAVLCLHVSGQSTPGKDAPTRDAPGKEANEAKGIPPRAAPTDYQTHVQVGAVTIAADFVGHAVPTPQGTFSTEDYVVVETAFFGPPEARLKISIDDFTLQINEKKPLPTRPYGMVFESLKDPEWEPPEPVETKSKTSLGTGGKGGQGDSPAPPPKMPFPLQRAMQQKVLKAAIPEGDRALPQAGLIFFLYRGKEKGIHTVELTYAGPAGKTTLTLQP
jgi:hypothetical protein